jgi:hypothetical protein
MLERLKILRDERNRLAAERAEERARRGREKAEERARVARERAEEKARIEAARIQEEAARLQAEKDVLMALSEKELLVEVMILLRGHSKRLDTLESIGNSLEENVQSLGWRVGTLDSNVDELRSRG